MTTDSFVFRDPPDIDSARSPVLAFIDALRTRPGEWAVYRSGMKQNSAHVNASALRKRHPNVTFVARKDTDGMYSIFGKVEV